jgi:glycosyltransferase involved in cell wall biosynthesis
MRIAQIMAGGPHGGAETFFERLVTALAHSQTYQQVIIRKDAARAARLMAAGVSPLEFSFGGLLDFFTPRQIDATLAKFRPDVTLVWMSRAAAKTPKRHAGVLCARLGGYYNLKYYRHCDHLIGNTLDIVDYLVAQGWPKERAHYLPNFVPDKIASPHPRASENTPPDVPLIVTCGRLHKNKGFDVLIDALAAVPNAWLWLAGEGEERAALEKLTADRGVTGRIKFLGWREDAANLVAAADLFVCPSRHEPLGNVVIEAFVQGRAVVAAASQGPKVLIQHGDNGLLTPIDDAAAMAAAIRQLLDNKPMRDKLAAAGRQTYEQNFTEAAVLAAYQNFFTKVTR